MAFISEAFAANASDAGSFEKSIVGFLPLFMLVFVVYFFMIRPQYKKVKEHAKLLDSIKKGDKIVISNGIVASVNRVDLANGCFFVEISSGVEVKILKSSVTELLSNNDESVKPSVQK